MNKSIGNRFRLCSAFAILACVGHSSPAMAATKHYSFSDTTRAGYSAALTLTLEGSRTTGDLSLQVPKGQPIPADTYLADCVTPDPLHEPGNAPLLHCSIHIGSNSGFSLYVSRDLRQIEGSGWTENGFFGPKISLTGERQ